MDKLYIFPYSGSGLEVLDCISDVSDVVFVSDDPEHIGQAFHGIPIISGDSLRDVQFPRLICVHGSAGSYLSRLQIIQRFTDNCRWETIIHPQAQVSRYATIGKNVFIASGVSIGPNAIIDDHVVILAHATIHHDTRIGAGSIICGNVLIAGNTEVGSQTYIGAGSTIKNGIQIGDGALIGMGSNVLQPVKDHEIWYGNPAKKRH